MNKRVKIIGISIILIVILAVILIYYPSEPSESQYLLLKSGDIVDIEGELVGVSYINTSYGDLPIVHLNSSVNIFRNVNLLDDQVYDIQGWSEALYIYGDPDKEYNEGENIDITLHFEEFKINNASFFWFKELGFYLQMLMAIEKALDATSYYFGIGLIQTSTISDNYLSYEVFTRNNDTYPLDTLNVSLLKIPTSIDYEDNVLFSEALNNTLHVFANQYVHVSGGDGIPVDFMSSLDDEASQNDIIEFIDKNSNNLLDDCDVFKFNVSPTSGETTFETYLISLGGGLTYRSNYAGGVKYIINWHKGAITEITTRRMGLSYVSYVENGSTIDTTIKVSRIKPVEGYPYDLHFLQLTVDDTCHNEFRLSDKTIEVDENISVEYFDSNNNSLLDANDLIIVHGIQNYSSAELKLFEAQKMGSTDIIHYTSGDEIGFIKWVVGDGYVKGVLPYIDIEDHTLVSGSNNIYQLNISVDYWHPFLELDSDVRVSLYRGSELIMDNVPVKDGVIETYNGFDLSFVDVDNDSYVSTNDYFLVECESPATYKLKFSSVFGEYTYYTFRHS